jgi:hypothetical protein
VERSSMRLIQDVKGVSRLFFVLALIVSFIIGALLSYTWAMGYYAPQEFRLPSGANCTVENVAFDPQNTSYFNVTVLNPSYSPSNVTVSKILARTTDDNRVHEINGSSPIIPYVLQQGVSQTFKCGWNWANYTGIKLPYTDAPVEILVFVKSGSGATFETKKPYVLLYIADLAFNSTKSVDYFEITVKNGDSSVTYVNITSVSVSLGNITSNMVTPSLPYGLAPGDAPVTFRVSWNWAAYQNQTVTVGVHTLQGYLHYRTRTIPVP